MTKYSAMSSIIWLFILLGCYVSSKPAKKYIPNYLTNGSGEIDSREHGTFAGKKITNCTCGWANKGRLNSLTRVVNGRETGINEFPWMAAVMSQRFKIVFCGGTIISPYHVMTAAHCIDKMKDRALAVTVGDHDLIRTLETEYTQVVNVKQIIEHESYHALGHPNDIALLLLEERIKFNQFVGPACLPTVKHDLEGESVKVIGWGRTSLEGIGFNVLLKANLKVVPIEECDKSWTVRIPGGENQRQICTYGNTRDSCKGDSGGPIVWLDPDTNRYTIVGIVSFGKGCANKVAGVNTLVAYYLDWIQNKIAASNPNGITCAKI